MKVLFTPLPIQRRTAVLPGLLRKLQQHLRSAARCWRRARDADRMAHSLAQLDDRTLRDLGLHRSEITSLTADMSGLTPRDRTPAMLCPSRGI